jgi:hypothetical protein
MSNVLNVSLALVSICVVLPPLGYELRAEDVEATGRFFNGAMS